MLKVVGSILLFVSLLVLTGCGALSKPGAMDRLMGLNSYAASAGKTPQQFYDQRYYSDGKTPAQRLAADYDQVTPTSQP